MKRVTLENRLQARQTTIDEPMIKEIVRDYNRFNLLYAKKTGRNYIPR